ncbi:MAG: hypothetical protein WCP17_02845 [bacterium]
MITQELLGYIRGEIAKGRTREEINTSLLSGGGWNENDLSEAFKAIYPMQGSVFTNLNPQIIVPPSTPIPPPTLSKPIAFVAPQSQPIFTPPFAAAKPPAALVSPIFTPRPTLVIPPSTPNISSTFPKPIATKAFVPPQSPAAPTYSPSLPKIVPLSSPPPLPPVASSGHPWGKFLLVFLILGGLAFAVWFFRFQIQSLISTCRVNATTTE